MPRGKTYYIYFVGYNVEGGDEKVPSHCKDGKNQLFPTEPKTYLE